MSKRTTLGDLRNSRIPKILDLCKDDARVRDDYANPAQRILLDCGKWAGVTQRIRLCVSAVCKSGCNKARCLTVPREVAAVEGITIDGQPILLRNNFFEFLPFGPGQSASQCGWTSCDGFQRDSTATFDDIIPPNKGLRIHPANIADAGKLITFYGPDDNGAPIVGGVTVTLAAPFATSTIAMSAITDVQKDVTLGRLLVYELNMAFPDPGDWTERLIAIYQPGETRPNYARYLLPDGCCCRSGCSNSTVLALVRLGYVAAVADADYLVIGNLDALELMCQGLRAKENGNLGGYEAFMRDAIKQLNRELITETSNRVAIDFPAFGQARFSRKMRGFI
jgi:hypothetical protein